MSYSTFQEVLAGMQKRQAIPHGFMTVGEVAKKMEVSVRTLQYYDREGLLSPSAQSEGGRRLYTDKDLVKLHQVLSLKSLGFSLEDIRHHLIALETPADVADALTRQAAAIREKISSLTQSLEAIEALKAEVLQMQTVDFKKYADIIVNLQMKNEFYWVIKHLDDSTLESLRGRFDIDSGKAMMATFMRLYNKAVEYESIGVDPAGEQGIDLARDFWAMITDFTQGDMTMLPQLEQLGSHTGQGEDWEQKMAVANRFIEPALEAYFTSIGYNPFEEGTPT